MHILDIHTTFYNFDLIPPFAFHLSITQYLCASLDNCPFPPYYQMDSQYCIRELNATIFKRIGNRVWLKTQRIDHLVRETKY